MIKNIKDKKVILRVDFNVPLDSSGQITDDTRIRAALPTIRTLLDRGAAVIILSHLGRPLKDLHQDGTIKKEKYSLRHIVSRLSELTGTEVNFVADTIGVQVDQALDRLHPGEILLLENTRFYAEEKQGDADFAKALARLGDVYINDAFGTAHRAHASTAIIAQYFDADHKGFGQLMEREIHMADKLLYSHRHPFISILGGAKVSDKILLIKELIPLTDIFIVGGAMAFTFIQAQGGEVGNSLIEQDQLLIAQELMSYAQSRQTQFLLPKDVLAADRFSADADTRVCPAGRIPKNYMGLDIGPASIEYFSLAIAKANSILWNGPMGVFEIEKFARGTWEIAKAVAAQTEKGAFTLVGGGDSVAALKKTGLQDHVSFVSTGGGAMLSYLEGKELPAIAAIKD